MCLSFKHLTGDHSKQPRPWLDVVQKNRFLFEIVIEEKWTAINFFFE